MQTFTVSYQITCFEGETIHEKTKWICLEQSVELPEELVLPGILEKVIGRVKDINPISETSYLVDIEWPCDNIGHDRIQFLNVLFGNISLKPGIRILNVEWAKFAELFNGPAFGIRGIRQRRGIEKRPMACGVLKPMGLESDALAELAYDFSTGGIDFIKDDHSLADQVYAPFTDRVTSITTKLKHCEEEFGYRAHYYPNITGTPSQMKERYEMAKESGADGVMVLPHLSGFETMHELASSEIDLPIMAHPAFSGALVSAANHGFSPAFLYGELYRAFGADFTIYPNTGGRFSFSGQECIEINNCARTVSSPFKPMFPLPGGGMKRETIPHWVNEYGNDMVFLIGASLFQHPDGIQKAVRELIAVLETT